MGIDFDYHTIRLEQQKSRKTTNNNVSLNKYKSTTAIGDALRSGHVSAPVVNSHNEKVARDKQSTDNKAQTPPAAMTEQKDIPQKEPERNGEYNFRNFPYTNFDEKTENTPQIQYTPDDTPQKKGSEDNGGMSFTPKPQGAHTPGFGGNYIR